MAKKDNADEKDSDAQDQAPKENVMAKKADESAGAEPSTEGLVKMSKGAETQHVHPTAVKAHVSAGWKHS
jgi:hypothetical protein